MTTIYLIRHGEIAESRPRRFIGNQELALTRTGQQQMAAVARFLASQSIDQIVCSPLSRCQQGAAIIAERLKKPVRIDRRLSEIDLGGWQGLTVAEVTTRYPGQYAARGRDLAGFRPEGGESFQDLLKRSWPVFTELAGQADCGIAIIGHAGVNRVILCQALGIELANLFRLGQEYGCINTLAVRDGLVTIQRLNCRPEH
ncbi:MAG: histidine phosphatase family protein [Desulfopila sp.]